MPGLRAAIASWVAERTAGTAGTAGTPVLVPPEGHP
jgi:hypothetical protein